MNHEEYFRFLDEFCKGMSSVSRKKNQDYTGDSGDPFANFRAVEKLGICSTETGFLVRMLDKLVRISNLADGRKEAVLDEKIEDTLHDLANYSALFAAYLKGKQLDKLADYLEASQDLEDSVVNREWNGQEEDLANFEWPSRESTSPIDKAEWPFWEIRARNNRGDSIVIESHLSAKTADTRMRELEPEWPTFTLTVVPK